MKIKELKRENVPTVMVDCYCKSFCQQGSGSRADHAIKKHKAQNAPLHNHQWPIAVKARG